jgi:NAD(P)-dependent dehydrogenase (short-subunit alcohol dehydrogenase family)
LKTSLQDKIVFVTGGASGIGEACVRLFAGYGCNVVIGDINFDRASTIAKELKGRAVKIDVGSEASIEAAVVWAEGNVGSIDVLVTSAGVIQKPLRAHELGQDVWDRVVQIDQRGTYITCREVGTRMAKRGFGSIINIASITGLRSVPLHAYAPAKAAVISMTSCLAAEWGRSGVRVNAVSPGYTLTPALQDAIDKGERNISALTDNSAAGRLVESSEVAQVIAFLASNLASGITGVNLPVDVGWLTAGSWDAYGGVPKKM